LSDAAGHLVLPFRRFRLRGRIRGRANNVTAQVNAAVPNVAFAITSNGGNGFGTSSNALTFTGTAPLAVRTIEVNGVSYPITWISTTTWSLALPLLNGPNLLVFQLQFLAASSRPPPLSSSSLGHGPSLGLPVL
jgi:hypothetical protein